MVIVNDGYMMLLDALYVGSKKVGNISDEGIDWAGDDAQFVELNAAQVRTAPVKKIPTKAATNVITGNLIELIPENCKNVMGGTVSDGSWHAPANLMTIEEPVKILTGTGQTVNISKALLTSAVRGGLGGEKTLGINFRLEVVSPGAGLSPFSFSPTVPFISATPDSLQFVAAGESKEVVIDASSPFAVFGAVPAGFSVEVVAGKIIVTASENTSAAERNGEISFALVSDNTKKVTISVTQEA